MPPRGHTTVKVSMTETSAFRRLVEFVAAVEQHAETEDDYGLRALVDELRTDLLNNGR